MIVRISEAAGKIGVHPSTLRNLEKRGLIRINRDWAGFRIFSENEIEQIRERIFPREKEPTGEKGQESKEANG